MELSAQSVFLSHKLSASFCYRLLSLLFTCLHYSLYLFILFLPKCGMVQAGRCHGGRLGASRLCDDSVGRAQCQEDKCVPAASFVPSGDMKNKRWLEISCHGPNY